MDVSSVRQICRSTLSVGLPIPRSSWLTSAVLIPLISEKSLMVSPFSLRN